MRTTKKQREAMKKYRKKNLKRFREYAREYHKKNKEYFKVRATERSQREQMMRKFLETEHMIKQSELMIRKLSMRSINHSEKRYIENLIRNEEERVACLKEKMKLIDVQLGGVEYESE